MAGACVLVVRHRFDRLKALSPPKGFRGAFGRGRRRRARWSCYEASSQSAADPAHYKNASVARRCLILVSLPPPPGNWFAHDLHFEYKYLSQTRLLALFLVL